MKFLPFPALVLLLLCVALAGLAAFAASPLLYSVEKDQAGTVFHKNPEVLRQAAANSTTDMVPLMQDVIDGQEPIAVDIRLRDLPAGQHDLAAYALRYASLRGTVFSLDLAGGEIGAFLTGTSLQKTILAELMNQTAAFDAIQKVARRPENSNNTEVQAAVASQSAALKTSIRALSDRYSVSHAGVMDTSTKLSLDTTEYQKAEAEIQRLVAEIAAAELPEADPAYLEETRITLMIDPEEVTYRQSVQMFGVVSPPGVKRTVSLRLDNLPVMSLSTDTRGNYFTSYTVERIRAGEHTIAAGSGSRAPAEKTLRVTRVGSVTTLAAEPGLSGTETGAICSGTVMANYPVRNAPVTILSDGSSRTDTTTYEDGTFEVFVPLSPGNHTLRAEFSSEEYPISPSLSEEVTIEVLPPPVSFGLPEKRFFLMRKRSLRDSFGS